MTEKELERLARKIMCRLCGWSRKQMLEDKRDHPEAHERDFKFVIAQLKKVRE